MHSVPYYHVIGTVITVRCIPLFTFGFLTTDFIRRIRSFRCIWLFSALAVFDWYYFLFARLSIISTFIIDQEVKWTAVVNDFRALTVFFLYLCTGNYKYLLDVQLELPIVCPLFHLRFRRLFCCVESVLQIFMYLIMFYTLYIFEETRCKFVMGWTRMTSLEMLHVNL